MTAATSHQTSRRQFRQTELTSLINLAMNELARYAMASRGMVKQDDGREQEEWITSRVSPSKIARKARNLLEIYAIEGAAPRMTEWVKELAGDEYISYRNAHRERNKNARAAVVATNPGEVKTAGRPLK